VPTRKEIHDAINVGTGRVPYDIAYGETPLKGGLDIGEVGGVPINATDFLPADLGANALLKLSMLGKGAGIPILAGMIKTPYGRIAENSTDTNKLADMLERAGNNAGYVVNREGSGVSPSQYVTFGMRDSDGNVIGERQVRISNHADKYKELTPTSGKRFSSDPSTENTFENAVNWLNKEGYPTNLSTRYSVIPDVTKSTAMSNINKEEQLRKLQAAWLNKPKATRGEMPTIANIVDNEGEF
jgi:hypothetical protein